jgi:hypothetical protein
MSVSVQNPTKCEVRAVIRFLHAKGETAAEIHRQLVSVYAKKCYEQAKRKKMVS